MSIAWDRAVEGMRRAAAHADDVEPEWSTRAGEALSLYIEARGGQPFTAPEARHWCEGNGLPAPAHGRAWGVVFRRAAKAGEIALHGFVVCGDHDMGCRPVRVWASPQLRQESKEERIDRAVKRWVEVTCGRPEDWDGEDYITPSMLRHILEEEL